MKHVALKLAVTFAAVAAVAAAQAQSVQVTFRPNKDRYARGESLSFVITVRDSAGRRLANAPVKPIVKIKSTGQEPYYPTMFTNAAGEVVVPYSVPLSPFADNIYMDAWAITDGGFRDAEDVRLPIGR